MGAFRHKVRANVETEEKLSIGRLFTQDLRRLDVEREESAARERLRALDPVPGFLFCVHLVCATVLMASLPSQSPEIVTLLAPLGALLLIDLSLWVATIRRPVSHMIPHVVTRCAALYV